MASSRPGSDTPQTAPGELVDLAALVAGLGWPARRVTALRNTCAAAAATTTMSPEDRAIARAVADALSGQAAGISPDQLAALRAWGLL